MNRWIFQAKQGRTHDSACHKHILAYGLESINHENQPSSVRVIQKSNQNLIYLGMIILIENEMRIPFLAIVQDHIISCSFFVLEIQHLYILRKSSVME